jgi:hypothetical protein
MATVGCSREKLAGTLNSAFAQGLLSESTHSYRLGLLFGRHLIDQKALAGDLTLRRGRSQAAEGARDAWAALLESARTLMRHGESPSEPLLLVLDRFDDDRLLVGRHPRCDVVLADPSVSRKHAQITFRDGTWMIQDLASTNGTLVNDVPVGRMALRAGDIVDLGSASLQID